MMSGYIMLQHALLTKPEFRRLCTRVQTFCKARSWSQAQALALGCLIKLWIVADDHIAEDDTLDMSAHEVDQLLGIDGISKILGPNWLEILDSEDKVRLPNWNAHNNHTTRKKAQDLARQHKHRAKKRAMQRAGVTECNGDALQGVTPPVTHGVTHYPILTNSLTNCPKDSAEPEPPTAKRRGSGGLRHVGDLLKLKT